MSSEQARERELSVARYEPWSSNPFAAMRRLSDEMERMVEGVWGRRPGLLRRPGAGEDWTPTIEMFERGKRLVVRAELPGLSRDQIQVELSDNTLIIGGERKEEKEQKDNGYYTCERSYGAFHRAIRLPEGTRGEEATAVFKDGVLEVTMPAPKTAEKHGRRIDVKSS